MITGLIYNCVIKKNKIIVLLNLKSNTINDSKMGKFDTMHNIKVHMSPPLYNIFPYCVLKYNLMRNNCTCFPPSSTVGTTVAIFICFYRHHSFYLIFVEVN